MNKKNLKIFIIVLGVILAAAVAFSVVWLTKSSKDSGGDTSDNTPEAGDYSFIDDFCCVTTTFGGDPTTSVNITWNSLSETVGSVELWQASESSESCQIYAATQESDTFSVPIASEVNFKNPELAEVSGSIFRCYITDLLPDTEYNYRLFYGDASASSDSSASEIYSFTTMPSSCEAFSFLLFADTQGFTQSDFDIWGKVADIAGEKYSDISFILHMGDTVEEGKNLYQWQMYFEAAGDLFKNNTVVSLLGNQDKQHTLCHYTYGSSDNRTALTSGYFSFDVGNYHFIVLNSGDGDKDIPKAQLKWLKKDLEAASDKNSIILIHKAPYSNANHCLDSEILEIRAQISEIASDYNVKLVISGHDHYIFRGNYSYYSDAADSAKTTYFINGSSGCKQHSGKILDNELECEVSGTLTLPTFSYCKADGNTLTISTYTVNTTTGATELIDEFSVEFGD